MTTTDYVNNITYQYPSDITNDIWKKRSVMILIKDQTSLVAGAKVLADKANSMLKDGAEAGKAVLEGDLNSKKVEKRNTKIEATTILGIALPLPNELSDSQSHNWSTTEGFVSQSTSSITSSSPAKVLAELSANAGFRKPLVDPGYFQDYKGTEPRSFTFTFDLIPKSEDEANQINKILYSLKKYTLPTTTISSLTLASPYLFDIFIGNDKLNSLINMTNVVCTNMSITFGADGGMQLLPDGTPKHTRLELSFTERMTVTADYY